MIRYKKLGYVELNVTDLARSRDFYENIVGLEFAGAGPAGELRLRCSTDPYALVLHQSAAAGIKRAGWMLEDENQFDALTQALQKHGVAYEYLCTRECSDRGLGRALRMVEPYTQATQEFYVLPPGTAPRPWMPTLARIMGLGHIVYRTPHKDAAVKFFREVLNFPESDSVGELITFMRCWPNPYHHGLGLAQSNAIGMHHLNFMVTEIDDLGRGFHRLNARKVPIMKGLGRHPASMSVFLYYLDPDNLSLEYSFGMEEFSETAPRPARTLPLVPESIDLWGTPTDSRYAKTGETERYVVAPGETV